MKKILAFLLAFSLVLPLAGCQKEEKEITCQLVIECYEALGYEVFHSEDEIYDWVCYVKAADPETEDEIYFHFFTDESQAAAYADTRQYHVLIWMFSVIFGDPSWLNTVTYQNIEIEYDNSSLYKPFQALINS